MNIGFNIRNRRKELGMTQEELADVAGVSLSSVKLIEQGKMNPTIQMMDTLMDCLGMEIIVRPKEAYMEYKENKQ